MSGHWSRWTSRRLGALILLSYLAGGPGAGAASLTLALRHAHGHGSACGCRGGHDCCGAGCCAPAETPTAAASSPAAAPALPACCQPEALAGLVDCCAPAGATGAIGTTEEAGPRETATESATAAAPTPAEMFAIAARCTCGDRDHHPVGVPSVDVHLPAMAGAGLLPPLPSRSRQSHRAARPRDAGEPLDPVPIASPPLSR